MDQAMARARLELWKRSLLGVDRPSSLLDVHLADCAHGAGDSTVDGDSPLSSCAVRGLEVPRLELLLAAGHAVTLACGVAADATPDNSDGVAAPEGVHTDASVQLLAGWAKRHSALATGRAGHALWLGLGVLISSDAGVHAPIALRAVVLRPRKSAPGFRLVAVDDRVRVNHTLIEHLRTKRQLALPEIGQSMPAGPVALDPVAALWDLLREATRGRGDWRVDEVARLGFWPSAANLLLWEDLAHRGEQILSSPVSAHLAAASGQRLEDAHNNLVTHEQAVALAAGSVPLCLDADIDQLAAVASAGRGASFVLHGPPGSGKSQTVANVVAHTLGQGKTVLVVAGQHAALEAARDRLAGAGLADFCWSAFAPGEGLRRQPVLNELGRILDRAWRPAPQIDRGGAIDAVRAPLDATATALHSKGPLGFSVYEALTELVPLRNAPRLPSGSVTWKGLTPANVQMRQTTLDAYADAAERVVPVATHPWRDSSLATWQPSSLETVSDALAEVEAAAATLGEQLKQIAIAMPGVQVRTHKELETLGQLLAVAAESPRPGLDLVAELGQEPGESPADDARAPATSRPRTTSASQIPRDPIAYLLLLRRQNELCGLLRERWTDQIFALDAATLADTFRRWSDRRGLVRYVALRAARAELRRASLPSAPDLPDDVTIAADLDIVAEERMVARLLTEASTPARRWFAGMWSGSPRQLDLESAEAAISWARRLRQAFAAVTVEGPRERTWRALVAQVTVAMSAGVVASTKAGEAEHGERGEERQEPTSPTSPMAPMAPVSPVSPAAETVLFARSAEAVARWLRALARLRDVAAVDVFDVTGPHGHVKRVSELVDKWRPALGQLREWSAYVAARAEAMSHGLTTIVTACETGSLLPSDAAPAWRRALLLAWADDAVAGDPHLWGFHGANHHGRVAQFVDLDRSALSVNRHRLVAQLIERAPRPGHDVEGQVAQLQSAIRSAAVPTGNEPAALPSLAESLEAIPQLLPMLKPCFLTTPLGAAQLLPRGLPRFDVVIIDEASLLTTAEAIGVISRADVAVVIGDARQLPPLRVGAVPNHGALPDLESILDECVAARLPQLSLAGSYRARHPQLMEWVSRTYYSAGLRLFPSPWLAPEHALRVVPVEAEGDCGASAAECDRRTVREAESTQVVDELIRQLERSRTVAVVAMSDALARSILQRLALRCEQDPQVAGLVAAAAASSEPALVTSIDHAQGLERDVVLVALDLGRSDGSDLASHVLASVGGERRLAVALSRAREHMVVYRAVPGVIGVGSASARGLTDLADFFAERARDDEEAGDAIAQQIDAALTARGWLVRHRVGAGGDRVDLAVLDPDDPDRCVLAIELDGPVYASYRWATDRERIRPAALAARGWRLHRIWALDWWADPERETVRAHTAIISAVAAARHARRRDTDSVSTPVRKKAVPKATRSARGSAPNPAVAAGVVAPAPAASEASVASPLSESPKGSRPTRPTRPTLAPRIEGQAIPTVTRYQVAPVPAGRRRPDDLFEPRHAEELGRLIDRVLDSEAPVNVGLLSRRVGAYFGVGRVTPRVTEYVRQAANGRGHCGAEEDVIWRLDQDPTLLPPVRVATEATGSRRDIDEVPLAELAGAALVVVERVGRAETDALVRDVARLLGFARLSERIGIRVRAGIRHLDERGGLIVDGDEVRLAPRA